MATTFVRTGLILAMAACAGSQAFALDAKKWSIIDNRSNADQVLQIADNVVPTGNVYIKKDSETGDGAKLAWRKDNFTMKAKTTYHAYFDTAAGNLALTISIGSGNQRTEINFARGLKTGFQGDRLTVSPSNYLSGSGVTIRSNGFRNFDAGAFIVIEDVASAAD